MAISWYPGHMAKTKRMIQESLKLCDAVVELCDARIPRSSRNPVLGELLEGKPSLLILNKFDLADPRGNDVWMEYLNKNEKRTILCDAQSGAGVEKIPAELRELLKDKLKIREERGAAGRPVSVMIAGVPNVGKSSLINRLSGRKSLKTEDRPGVTRDKSWTKLAGGIELLDTPGILWPRFENPEVAENLAFTGAVKDDVLDLEEVASSLLKRLARSYPGELSKRYRLEKEDFPEKSGFEILEEVGRGRGLLLRGGEIDTLRAAKMLLLDFRGGKIGRITLERPGE